MTESHPQYVLQYRGIMAGHTGWVTSIATAQNTESNVVISGSRDKSIIVWNIVKDEATGNYGVPRRRMTGHSHFVSDVVLSSDAQFALSGSWDNTLRLWDVNTGKGRSKFGGRGHTKSVLSVAFSADNRQIVSGSMDKTIRLWNTLGECKHTIETDGAHSEWVSCVRFSPNPGTPLVVSSSWDKTVKVWNLKDCKLQTTLQNHNGYINTVTVSPDGSLCASAGKDGFALLWDLSEGKHLYSLDAGDVINALVFSPDRYWLCAATQKGIRIWDLESKTVETEIDTTHPDFFAHASNVNAPKAPTCTSLAWSADGRTLFSGHSDNVIRVWEVRQ